MIKKFNEYKPDTESVNEESQFSSVRDNAHLMDYLSKVGDALVMSVNDEFQTMDDTAASDDMIQDLLDQCSYYLDERVRDGADYRILQKREGLV